MIKQLSGEWFEARSGKFTALDKAMEQPSVFLIPIRSRPRQLKRSLHSRRITSRKLLQLKRSLHSRRIILRKPTQ